MQDEGCDWTWRSWVEIASGEADAGEIARSAQVEVIIKGRKIAVAAGRIVLTGGKKRGAIVRLRVNGRRVSRARNHE